MFYEWTGGIGTGVDLLVALSVFVYFEDVFFVSVDHVLFLVDAPLVSFRQDRASFELSDTALDVAVLAREFHPDPGDLVH